MNSINGLKTCRKGLHQYPADKKGCPECQRERYQKWAEKNREKKRRFFKNWYRKNIAQQREKARMRYQQNPDKFRERGKQWRRKNREYLKEHRKEFYRKNKERLKQQRLKYYYENLEEEGERNRRWRNKNIEHVRRKAKEWRQKNCELRKKLNQKWCKTNQASIRARNAVRRATKKQATPSWANHTAINAIYAEAVRLEKETGIRYHVDHIYPLQSDYMCGLHVAENLQVLPGAENIKKGNRTWPGQLECQRLPIDLSEFTTRG